MQEGIGVSVGLFAHVEEYLRKQHDGPRTLMVDYGTLRRWIELLGQVEREYVALVEAQKSTREMTTTKQPFPLVPCPVYYIALVDGAYRCLEGTLVAVNGSWWAVKMCPFDQVDSEAPVRKLNGGGFDAWRRASATPKEAWLGWIHAAALDVQYGQTTQEKDRARAQVMQLVKAAYRQAMTSGGR